MKTGSCLCGGVAFKLTGPLRPIVGCHCTQCRKQSGHFGMFTASDDADLNFTSDNTLAWFRASDTAQRGFCNTCGSLLFWKGDGRSYTSIAAGAIDGATHLKIEGHIFCADKGDYYDIQDGEYRKPHGR
jgi:hypothetical protein